MKKTTKVLALVLCAMMLVVGSVMGTLAYLTFTTEEVKNTFTVGNVNLGEEDEDGNIKDGLNEAKVNEYGVILYVTGEDTDANPIYTTDKDAEGATIAERVLTNTYKLVPDHTYVKDPTIHVGAGSEACYLFVEVKNGITAIEAADVEGEAVTTIAGQMSAKGWTPIMEGSDIYYYTDPETNESTVATTADAGKDVIVFESFTISKDADNTALDNHKTATITVKAYAVQAEGIDDAVTAWSLTFGAQQDGDKTE